MDFVLSDDERLLQESVREFAQGEIAPFAAETDRNAFISHGLIVKMAKMGLLGICVPPEWGGAGMSTLCYAIALEEVAAACGSTSTLMAVNNSLACWPLNRFGTDAQKGRFLRPIASGEKLGAFALTEASAGSDAVHIQTTARKVEGGYRLSGQKTWVTSAPVADFFTVFAKAGEERICEVIAHEIAHQWFGNLVTPSDWRYLWLNESFASYMEKLASAESQEFGDPALQMYRGKRGAYRTDQSITTHPVEGGGAGSFDGTGFCFL